LTQDAIAHKVPFVAIVKLTLEAGQQVNALPQPIRRRLLEIYERLAKWPNVSGVSRFEEIGREIIEFAPAITGSSSGSMEMK
jgi:hypothetical protein